MKKGEETNDSYDTWPLFTFKYININHVFTSLSAAVAVAQYTFHSYWFVSQFGPSHKCHAAKECMHTRGIVLIDSSGIGHAFEAGQYLDWSCRDDRNLYLIASSRQILRGFGLSWLANALYVTVRYIYLMSSDKCRRILTIAWSCWHCGPVHGWLHATRWNRQHQKYSNAFLFFLLCSHWSLNLTMPNHSLDTLPLSRNTD